jgi:hypothetical protein
MNVTERVVMKMAKDIEKIKEELGQFPGGIMKAIVTLTTRIDKLEKKINSKPVLIKSRSK